MSYQIEFIGSPGVGKSTIYQELEKKWDRNAIWIPDKYLFPRKRKSLLFKPKKILSLGFSKDSHQIDVLALREAGDRFVALYPEYMEACWNNIHARQKKHLNGLDLRFAKANYLYQLVQKIQCVDESNNPRVAIVDEGLVHSIYNGLYWSETEEEEKQEIKNLLKVIPLPKGLISIETSFSENISRLLERKKVISMHKSLIVSDLESVIRQNRSKRALLNQILKEFGIPLLHLDSSKAPQHNTSEIIKFIDQLRQI
jgi:predicted CopG family antitoxin